MSKSIRRRALLRATGLAAIGAGLAACTLSNGVQLTPAMVVTDVGNISKSLASVLPALGTAQGIPAATLAQVTSYVTLIEKAGATLAPQLPAAGAVPVVQQVAGWVNAIVSTLAGVGSVVLPPPVPEILAAAVVVLPVVEAALGITPAAAASGKVATFRAALPAMDVDRARAVLAAYAGR